MSVPKHGKRAFSQGMFPVDYELTGSLNSEKVAVFFHGYGQHFGFMKKKFQSLFQDTQLLFINGIYPLAPDLSVDIKKIKLRFAWYFFNPLTNQYFISPDTPALVIKNLLFSLKLESKKLLFLGFSQGGYLAPFVAKSFAKSTVISINSNIRYDLLPAKNDFKFFSINGSLDKVVNPQNAKNSTDVFSQQGNEAIHRAVPTSGHEIDSELINACRQVIEKAFD